MVDDENKVDIRSALNRGWVPSGAASTQPGALARSWLYAHMCRALAAEPSWTVQMYCVFNDIEETTATELQALYTQRLAGGQ